MFELLLWYIWFWSSLFIPVFPLEDVYNSFMAWSLITSILLISFLLDLILLLIWKTFFMYWYWKKSSKNLFINNVIFRFFPIISHIWSFRSWNSNHSLKKVILTMIFGYVFVHIFVSSVIFLLELIYNYIWFYENDEIISLYIWYISMVSGLFLWLVYFIFLKFKKSK